MILMRGSGCPPFLTMAALISFCIFLAHLFLCCSSLMCQRTSLKFSNIILTIYCTFT